MVPYIDVGKPELRFLEWVRTYLPRYFALLPARRSESFLKGVDQATEGDRV
jgi:hypothetical protein